MTVIPCYFYKNRKKQHFSFGKLRRTVYPKVSGLPPGAITANGTALCHYVQLYRYFVSQHSGFCTHNPLCCFSTSVYCCRSIFSYRLSPETFGYILLCLCSPYSVVDTNTSDANSLIFVKLGTDTFKTEVTLVSSLFILTWRRCLCVC
jgi:hypothetical protein